MWDYDHSDAGVTRMVVGHIGGVTRFMFSGPNVNDTKHQETKYLITI